MNRVVESFLSSESFLLQQIKFDGIRHTLLKLTLDRKSDNGNALFDAGSKI